METGGEYLRDLVERIDQPAPVDVQKSYLAKHPRPDKKQDRVPHRKRPPGSIHGNSRVLITIGDETKSAHAWAKLRGFFPAKIINRIANRWHPTAAVLGNEGELRTDAHIRLGLPVPEMLPSGPPKGTPKVSSPPKPAPMTNCPIGMQRGRVTFSGDFELTPDKADELALNLIRMAEDIRRDMRR